MFFFVAVVVAVIESKATIVGPREVYVKQGSTLSLTCVVDEAVENAVVFWYHDAKVLDGASTRPPVHIDYIYDANAGQGEAAAQGGEGASAAAAAAAAAVAPASRGAASVTSRLRINNLQVAHSGNYTCYPTAADPAHVSVHVINGNLRPVRSGSLCPLATTAAGLCGRISLIIGRHCHRLLLIMNI